MTPSKKLTKKQIFDICERTWPVIIEKVTDLENKISQQLEHNKSQKQILSSVAQGLYVEIDKLSKKSPLDAISALYLSQLNDVIRDTKELLRDDLYIVKIDEFVPAGDNPENRDALLVCKQIIQGLDRYDPKSDSRLASLRTNLELTQFLRSVLQEYYEENELPVYEDRHSKFEDWFCEDEPYVFLIEKLRDFISDSLTLTNGEF